MGYRLVRVLALALALAGAGCGDDSAPADAPIDGLGLTRDSGEFETLIEGLSDMPIDPKPVVGASYHPIFPDPIPFRAEEWTTNPPAASVAVPDAPKGGDLRLAWLEWPPTLRTEGPNSRLSTLSDLHILIYETLLSYDVKLGDWTPNLATHWQVSADRLTYRFRLNPDARWADGREVTADDVVATIEHLMRADRQDPTVRAQWMEYFEGARMLDKYTVEVRAKQPYWYAMVMLGSQLIYPAAYIRMDGPTYREEWNYKLPPGSGPYELRLEDVRKGESIRIHRRPDWWQAKRPETAGMYNFDRITYTVVRDQELEFLKFRSGEFDFYLVSRAQQWVDELDDEEAIRNGWVQRRKIYSRDPEGYGGYCMNMRKPPFNDVRVRKAFAHLFNREQLFAKFFFYQYEYIDSYFPGQPWARPDASRIRFDPRQARELLAEAGYSDRNDEGFLVDGSGVRFPKLILDYTTPGWTRIHSVLKNDLWQEAGIELELRVIDGTSFLKKMWEYQYQISFFSWTASIFPNPEFQFHSKYADTPQSNNLNGVKNQELDAIMDAYRSEFDGKKRIRMLQEMDRILFDEHPYALAWYAPYFRICYWDKFGHPPEYAAAYVSRLNNVVAYWWYDENKAKTTEANREANRPNYPDRPGHQMGGVDQRWWIGHDKPMTETDGE